MLFRSKLVNPADNPDSKKPKAAKIISWHVESDPSSADVYDVRKDELLGKTPFRVEQPIQPGEVELELRLEGYQHKRITVKADENQEPPVVKLEPVKVEKDPKPKKDRGKSRRHGKK